MNYWLLKTEPSTYAYADLVKAGQAVWDGVSNALALKHIRTMQIRDQALIYHTGSERQAVGIAEVVSGPYPDPHNPKLTVIEVQALRPLDRPVALAQLKSEPIFSECALLKMPRLSVVPLTGAQWQKILLLASG
ncbi:MAG: EVE domain-containing protein [Pseudanabaenaceae cyanobacterium]